VLSIGKGGRDKNCPPHVVVAKALNLKPITTETDRGCPPERVNLMAKRKLAATILSLLTGPCEAMRTSLPTTFDHSKSL
jgi:hypothetical protein